MKVFISHTSDHAPLARILKEAIQDSFDGCTVFVSSDTRDIPPGSDWRDRIDEALEGAAAFIVLCSPDSIHRPWIPFETACGWIKRVPVIPVCYGGMSRSTLPLPFSRFQALDGEAGFAGSLLSALAGHLDLRLPKLDFSRYEAEMMEAFDQISDKGRSPPYSSDDDNEDHDVFGFLDPAEEEILQILANNGAQPPDVLANAMQIHDQAAKYWCEQLEAKRFAVFNRSMVGEPATYGIDIRGRAYLVENDLLE